MEGEPEEKGEIVLTVGSPFPHSSDLGLADAGAEDATLVAQGYAALTALRGPAGRRGRRAAGPARRRARACPGGLRLHRLRAALSRPPRGDAGPASSGSGGACPPPGAPASSWSAGSGGGPARPRSPASSLAASRSSASSRLRAWERDSDALARTTGPRRSSRRARWRGPSVGRGADVELHLHPAQRAVGVLAAGTARGRGAPGDLREGQVEAPAHVQGLGSGHPTSVRGPGYAPGHGLPTPRTLGHASLGPRLRQLDHPRQPDRGGRRGGVRESGARRRHHHLRHGRRLRHGRGRVGPRPGPQGRAPRLHRDLHQGLLADRSQPQQPRPLAQAHHGVAPRLARAAADRPRRPAPGPPLRLRDPAGGDAAGLRRPGAPGQGPLRRRLGVDGRADRGRRCAWPTRWASTASSPTSPSTRCSGG